MTEKFGKSYFDWPSIEKIENLVTEIFKKDGFIQPIAITVIFWEQFERALCVLLLQI